MAGTLRLAGHRNVGRRLAVTLLAVFSIAVDADAAKLPFQPYSVLQGLAHDRVLRIVSDSSGFLWFATAGGLSRFDGRTFTNYDVASGLEGPVVYDLLETRNGEYWATSYEGGIARLRPGANRFEKVLLPAGYTKRVSRLIEERSGRIWLAGIGLMIHDGAEPGVARKVSLPSLPGVRATPVVWDMTMGPEGSLWVATDSGVLRKSPDDTWTIVRVDEHNLNRGAYSIHPDRSGRIWVGFQGEVAVMVPPEASVREGDFIQPTFRCAENKGCANPSLPGQVRLMGAREGLSSGTVMDIIDDGSKSVWFVQLDRGLFRSDGQAIEDYSQDTGLRGRLLVHLGRDMSGRLWIGTFDGGALRLASTEIVAYGEADGLGYTRFATVSETTDGQIYVTESGIVYVLRGDRFETVLPAFTPPPSRRAQRFENAAVIQGTGGDWWLAARDGVYRTCPGVSVEQLSHAKPCRIYRYGKELPSYGYIARLWVVGDRVVLGFGDRIAIWNPKLDAFDTPLPPPVPALSSVRTVAADSTGALWLGCTNGLARVRDGKIDIPPAPSSLNAERSLLITAVDSRGALWVLSAFGDIYRAARPSDDAPTFERVEAPVARGGVIYTSLAEDRIGGVYLGTTRGVYFRDPLSASWRVYSAVDGLINDEIAEMHVDRTGGLWLTSQRGVARIVPEARPRRDVPPARIESVALSGTVVSNPWSQPSDKSSVVVEPELARLRVEFAANELLLRPLTYRFRLLGLDDAWIDAGNSRTANFGGLSPGRYQFEVVPVALDGVTGAPARFTFEVLRPRWARRGALGAYALLAGVVFVAVRRSRLERSRAIERVRSRIARDLHDDVGSSLTQIALIAEVLRQVPPASEIHVRERLGRMTALARESLDSFRDIIWALNPREGRIEEVTSRLRKVAAELDEGPEIQVAFDDPGVGQIRLRVEPKHHLYLIAKELVHNAVRHAKCNRVEVRVRVVDEEIELSVVDDGVGFAPDAANAGFGLLNVRRRTQTIGGRLEIDSHAARGTRIFVRVPLHSSSLLKRLNRRLAPWV